MIILFIPIAFGFKICLMNSSSHWGDITINGPCDPIKKSLIDLLLNSFVFSCTFDLISMWAHYMSVKIIQPLTIMYIKQMVACPIEYVANHYANNVFAIQILPFAFSNNMHCFLTLESMKHKAYYHESLCTIFYPPRHKQNIDFLHQLTYVSMTMVSAFIKEITCTHHQVTLFLFMYTILLE